MDSIFDNNYLKKLEALQGLNIRNGRQLESIEEAENKRKQLKKEEKQLAQEKNAIEKEINVLGQKVGQQKADVEVLKKRSVAILSTWTRLRKEFDSPWLLERDDHAILEGISRELQEKIEKVEDDLNTIGKTIDEICSLLSSKDYSS